MRVVGIVALASAILGCVVQPSPEVFPAQSAPRFVTTDKAIAVVGDLQMTPRFVRMLRGREYNEHEQSILMADLRERVDDIAALALVGDLVFTAASKRDWRHFDELVGPIASRVPLLPALGNHDYYCVLVQWCMQHVVPKNVRVRFPWLQPGEAYVVPYGRLALVFIDSETKLDKQGDWLRAQIVAFEQDYDAMLVFLHRPPYTNTLTGGVGADLDVQRYIVAALVDSDIATIVFSGHAHGYEHLYVDGIHHIVTAGGGGPRSQLSSDRSGDIYMGRNCARDELDRVLRPFNYVLVQRSQQALNVIVRGFCKQDEAVSVLERFDIPL